MEILLQIILEPLFLAYYDLVENFNNGKGLKKWQEYLLKIACLVVSLISFFLLLIGAFWVTDVAPFKTYGIVFLVVGGGVLFVHVIIALFVGGNRFVEEKREEMLIHARMEEESSTPQIYYVGTDSNSDERIEMIEEEKRK